MVADITFEIPINSEYRWYNVYHSSGSTIVLFDRFRVEARLKHQDYNTHIEW